MKKTLYSRSEMKDINIKSLNNRGVKIEDIAIIAFEQQAKFTKDITIEDCIESIEKLLSLRDVFHLVQLGIAIDIAAEKGQLEGPINNILEQDLGAFGVDEIFGLYIAGNYGAIGQTNFGDIDVNKPGIVKQLDNLGKKDGKCHCMLDDIVGGIAAAASTRVAQMNFEQKANK